MKGRLPAVLCLALVACASVPMQAQQSNRLTCQGTIRGVPAVLQGIRYFAPYNALDDGYVKFAGTISAGGISGRMSYEGYTRTAPFGGVISSPIGVYRVSVLDNTGGRMIIYGGGPSLGPPETVGTFVCDWQ
jgi:hypothetical protein